MAGGVFGLVLDLVLGLGLGPGTFIFLLGPFLVGTGWRLFGVLTGQLGADAASAHDAATTEIDGPKYIIIN